MPHLSEQTMEHKKDEQKYQETLTLIYATDEKMVMPLAVSVCSVLARLSNKYKVDLYVVDSGVAASTKKKIENVLQKKSAQRPLKINWIEPDPSWWGNVSLDFSNSTLTEATMYRFGLTSFLPDHATQAIYLDCDVFAKTDVSKMLALIPDDGVACAVPDYTQPTWGHRFRNQSVLDEIGFDREKPYFNAGILGINVKRWKEHDVMRRASEFIAAHKEHIRFFSQDPLNAALQQEWMPIDLSWNFHPTCRDKMNRHGLSLEQVFGKTFESLQSQAKLIHFTGRKPWNQGFTNPERGFFEQELKDSHWFTPTQYLVWRAWWWANVVHRGIKNKLYWKYAKIMHTRTRRGATA